MLLVILGAGASFDASTKVAIEDRLPLAKDIYAEHHHQNVAISQHPYVQPLAARLRKTLMSGGSIENELSTILAESESNPVTKRQLIAMRYYMQQMIADTTKSVINNTYGITNYTLLIEKLQQWRHENNEKVVIISFNYDTLIEQACQNSGLNWNLNTLDDYIDRPDFKLFKLHGSINWTRIVPQPFGFDGDVARNGDKMDLSRPQFSMGGVPGAHVGIPAIAIPVDVKYAFECPTEHVDVLTKQLQRVDKIITIGWRAAERHLRPMLSVLDQRPAKVQIVTASEAGYHEARQNLRSAIGKRHNIVPNERGFSNYIDGNSLEDFLSS